MKVAATMSVVMELKYQMDHRRLFFEPLLEIKFNFFQASAFLFHANSGAVAFLTFSVP